MPKIENKPQFKMILPRPVLELYRFAYKSSGDWDRKELTRIFVEIEYTGKGRSMKRMGHAVATDGHRLAHYWWPIEEPAKELPKKPFCLDPGACRDFMNAVKRPKGEPAPVFRVIANGNGLEIDADGDEYLSAEPEEVDKEYPDWRKILPPQSKSQKMVSLCFKLNGEYINDFTRYLHVLGSDKCLTFDYASPEETGPIRILPRDAHNAGSFEDYPGSVEYVLMPMR